MYNDLKTLTCIIINIKLLVNLIYHITYGLFYCKIVFQD